MFGQVLRSWRNLVVAVGALGAALSLTPSADAATINFASFGVGGAFSLPPGTHLGNTDTITISNGGAILVTQTDLGQLSSLVTFGGGGTLKDIPSLSAFTPISGYLTLNSGVSLDLTSLTIHDRAGPVPGFLNLSGRGMLYAPGYDPTEALVTLSHNTSDNVGFVLALQTSVPEPLPIALLGLGLVGLFYGRRMKITAKSQTAAI